MLIKKESVDQSKAEYGWHSLTVFYRQNILGKYQQSVLLLIGISFWCMYVHN